MMHQLNLRKQVIDFNYQIHKQLKNGNQKPVSPDEKEIQKPDEDSIMLYVQRIAMLENALQKAREEAFQSGFQEGQKSVEVQLKRQVEELPKEFAAMGQQLQDQFQNSLAKMEKPIMRFSVQIAEKILGQVLQDDHYQKQMLLTQVRKFLSAVVDESKVVIHINPKQMAWITDSDIMQSPAFANKLMFKNNDKLAPGECLLETENFIVDGTISGQLERLEKKIMSGD